VFTPYLWFFWKRLRCRCGKVAKFSRVEDAAAAAKEGKAIGRCGVTGLYPWQEKMVEAITEDPERFKLIRKGRWVGKRPSVQNLPKGTQFDGEA